MLHWEVKTIKPSTQTPAGISDRLREESNWNIWCPVITTYLSNSTCQVWLISTRVELVGSTTLLRSCVLISTYYMSELVIKFIYIIMIFFMFDNWWLKDKKKTESTLNYYYLKSYNTTFFSLGNSQKCKVSISRKVFD